MRRAAIDEHPLPPGNQARRLPPEAAFLIARHATALGEVRHCGRRWQRAAMDPLQQAFAGKFAQIAADRVLRKSEFDTHILGNDPAVLGKTVEQELFSLSR
jgi:hypothetical protein